MLAAAKALADSARETKVLVIRGGVIQGRTASAEEVERLATLPPIDVLRGQVIGAIIAPLSAIAGLVNAPLQNLYGLIDARIEQLGGADAAPAAAAEPQAEATAEPEADATASADPETTEATEEENA
jgi:large subunit ribosomal protein L10